jgi:predicted NAD/FAD-dependent oxidoreductase
MKKKRIAIIGAGMAGITAARTLAKAGHDVQVFEKSSSPGGRMATQQTPLGGFDKGAQYFTVRDARFAKAISDVPGTAAIVKPWSATGVRVLDAHGAVFEAAHPPTEPHFVAQPGMNALLIHWAQPLITNHQLHLNTTIESIQVDAIHPTRWQLKAQNSLNHPLKVGTISEHTDAVIHSGFDQVILAIPSPQASQLLRRSSSKVHKTHFIQAIDQVNMGPCWTLMLAFPQANQPNLNRWGPQWNCARSIHHRIAWLSRESSKPARTGIERWTVQASTEWSLEHLEDSQERVKAKLVKAFTELTGIYAQPSFVELHRWRYAKTLTALGKSFQWNPKLGLGTCGDWHIGHRVEDAFKSGLALALEMLKA